MPKGITTVSTIVRACDFPLPGVRRLVLADQDDWELPPFRPGAHIDLHLAKGLVRTYSLCNEPANKHRYVVAVKRETEGRGGSRFIHEELRVGDRIGVSLPRGGIEVSAVRPNVFIRWLAGSTNSTDSSVGTTRTSRPRPTPGIHCSRGGVRSRRPGISPTC